MRRQGYDVKMRYFVPPVEPLSFILSVSLFLIAIPYDFLELNV